MTGACWSACEDTAATLGRVPGLLRALDGISFGHSGPDSPDPTSNGIPSLIGVSEEKVEQATKPHEEELVRFRQERDEQPNAASERGK